MIKQSLKLIAATVAAALPFASQTQAASVNLASMPPPRIRTDPASRGVRIQGFLWYLPQ